MYCNAMLSDVLLLIGFCLYHSTLTGLIICPSSLKNNRPWKSALAIEDTYSFEVSLDTNLSQISNVSGS